MENRVHDIEVKREQGKVSIGQRNRNMGHRTDVDFHFRRLSTRRAVQLEYSPVKRRAGKTKADGLQKPLQRAKPVILVLNIGSSKYKKKLK